MNEDLKTALDILEEAVADMEQQWGPIESFQGEDDWTFRAVALLAKHQRRKQ
jgi:hypothetical protein